MAATIRRLAFQFSWLLVLLVASFPIIGVLVGLWPDEQVLVEDLARLLSYQGVRESALMSFFASLFAPLVGLYLAFVVYSQYQFNPRWQSFEKHLAPLLSLPHLALAMGLVFLFSGNGLLFSNIDIGLPRKGLTTLILAVVIKEVPFFLLIFSAIGRQLPIKTWLLQGKALGYQDHTSWWLLVFPAMLKQSRLALLAAMAYTLSVVDMSLLVGPNIPELFAVSLYRWQTSFSAGDQALAFWANMMLLAILGVSVVSLYWHERGVTAGLVHFAIKGNRLGLARAGKIFILWLPVFTTLTMAIVAVFFLWSFGYGWRSNANLLEDLTIALWVDEWLFFSSPLQNTVEIGAFASCLGIVLALLALELQRIKGHYFADYYWLLAILLPQLSMVLGWQVSHIWLEGGYGAAWIVLSHLPFTFAYGYLVLKGPFQSVDYHYELIGASFGYSRWQCWWKIRFRLLLPAIWGGLAITFAVSVAQYIPTLMIGAGRVPTITTEAVAIGTGSERGLIALYILLQSLLPFLAFLVAAILAKRYRGSV